MRAARLCPVLALVPLLLAGCAGGGQVRNVFPPRASIQQLSVQPDGAWRLQLRLQNYSNVSATFASIAATVAIAAQPAGSVRAAPNLRIGPESADVVDTALTPSPAARARIAAMHGGNVPYTLDGHIITSDPRGDYPFHFEGDLSPVPGLPGVLR